jgi:DNA primase
MTTRSVVKRIRKLQKSGVKMKVVLSPNAVPWEEYIAKMAEDARQSQRLSADRERYP